MSGLVKNLLPYVAAPASAELLRHYVHDGHFTGGRFETYADDRIRPSAITGDDVAAVTLLAIRVTFGGTSDIQPSHILALEDRADDIQQLLRQLPVDRPLHTLTETEFDGWLGDDSPGSDLFWLLRRDIGLPRVATYKLLARKRPQLLPLRDTKVENALHPGQTEWWRPWWEELSARPELVERLEELRAQVNVAHVSLVRVADICVWMWEHGADTDSLCPDLRHRFGPPPAAG